MKPSVTVLIDTYNHERFIEEAVVSVLEQDFPASETEILVVDDGSTDRTPEILRKFEPRIRVIRKQNGGQASAFNAGMPEARADIVAFLDGDDWWKREKLSRVMDAMAGDESLGIVGHGIVTVGQDGREQVETLRDGFRFRANTIEGAQMLRRRGSFLGTSRMTIRKETMGRIAPVPESIRIQADEFLFTLATVLAGAQILEEPLTYYRMHDANAFQIDSFDPGRMRAKQQSLAALAKAMDEMLACHGIDRRVRAAITEYPQASADRLRLQVDGGWSWETARTEWALYRVAHPEAPLSHCAFKAIVLLGALVLPPKAFYSAQKRISRRGFYGRVRERTLPIPEMSHIRKETQARP
jgi:glycosyltransferase involved in cell wall biosynthesis